MYSDILNAVTVRLNELFPDHWVNTHAVEQNLQTPCFFLSFLEPYEKQVVGQRYYRDTGMCIQYIPDDGVEDPDLDLCRVADLLLDGMEYIILADGNKMRGTGRKCKIVDGVVNFFVNYNGFVIKKKEPDPSMEQCDTDVELKG